MSYAGLQRLMMKGYAKRIMLAWLAGAAVVPGLALAAPEIEGRAALLVDAGSGQVLYTKNADQPYAPASTIKLLTALLVWEGTKLQGSVCVQPADTYVEPSHIPLRSGEVVGVNELTRALLIGSDNDSAMALARYTAGSVGQFVTLMNTRARQLGCVGTMAKNPHGLPVKGQYTTAADMLKIFQAVLAVPELRAICATPRYQLTTAAGTQTIKNHNKLLGAYAGMGPAKTGWTYSSRHTYAASATRDGRELQLVILNSPNKWNDARMLFDYGFKATRPQSASPVLAAGQSSGPPAVAVAAGPLANNQAAANVPAANDDQGLTVYQVKKGDTLSSICRRFDVSMRAVLRHNNLPNPHVITPGLILYLPLQS